MVRMYINTAEQMLMVLLYAYYSVGLNKPSDAARWCSRNYVDVWGRDLAAIIGGYYDNTDDKATIQDMIKDLAKQITQSRQGVKSEDATLIDLIVQQLQLPFVRNALPSTTLKAFSRAILNPEEIVAVKEDLKTRELHCECDHKFVSGEAVSFVADRDNSYPVIKCHRCYKPTTIACDKCVDGNCAIPKAKKVFDCGCSAEGAAPQPELRPMDAMNAQFEQILRAGQVRNAAPDFAAVAQQARQRFYVAQPGMNIQWEDGPVAPPAEPAPEEPIGIVPPRRLR